MRQCLPLFLVAFLLFLALTRGVFVAPVQAQSLGFAEYINSVEQENLQTGSIVAHQEGVFVLTNEPYDKDIFGVVALDPAIELRPLEELEEIEETPVVRNGMVNVRVNGENGPITAGQLVTSSSTPGVGMRSTKSGFILGVAQAEFNPSSPEQEAIIPILLDIRFAFSDDSPQSSQVISRLMSVVGLNTLSFIEEPVKTLRYTTAAIAILLSLALSFLSFGRVAFKGVEAIGRNPLAKNSILTGVIINTILAVALAAAGVAVAYIIVTW